MARAAVVKRLTTKAKTQKSRTSRAVKMTLDDKYYGGEPIDITKKGFIDALNWYNYMYENDEVRPWLFDYLKASAYSKQDIAAIRRLPKHNISKTTCSVARILSNGNTLPAANLEYFNNTISELISVGTQVKEVVEDDSKEKPFVSIQERTRAKIGQLITDCEEALDADPNLNIYDWLKGKDATAQAATAICDYYTSYINDYQYQDEFATRAEIKHNTLRLKYWEQFVYDCSRFIGNKKVSKIRKPKEKKQKSAVELTSKLKYQKDFPPLKIVSVNPAEIIGCNQLWLFNTKYRKLTRYDALGPNGIQAKGASLIGFDVEKSVTKSIRKPETTIPQILSAGKVTLRKFMDDIKTNSTAANGRLNSDTIILRVVK